jgi:hypothetical protein
LLFHACLQGHQPEKRSVMASIMPGFLALKPQVFGPQTAESRWKKLP